MNIRSLILLRFKRLMYPIFPAWTDADGIKLPVCLEEILKESSSARPHFILTNSINILQPFLRAWLIEPHRQKEQSRIHHNRWQSSSPPRPSVDLPPMLRLQQHTFHWEMSNHVGVKWWLKASKISSRVCHKEICSQASVLKPFHVKAPKWH